MICIYAWYIKYNVDKLSNMAASVCWTCVLSLLEKSHDWKKKEWKQENDKILIINVTNKKNYSTENAR